MSDPTADPLAGPPEGSAVTSVGVQVGSGSLALTPDQGMLASSKTVFPVYVDPVWKTVTRSEWAMVSSGFPDEPYWEFKGNSTEGVGFCDVSWDYDCYRDQTKRVMYRLPVSAYWTPRASTT